jgi:16S rRNA G966 N2-methylase RsmD
MEKQIYCNFLNKRNSLRNLSDNEFESILESLAEEISQVDYTVTYDDKKLLDDWTKLQKWNTDDITINSTNRIGMKLCEHFFPNFYEIQNKNGQSFSKLWNKDNLIKILRWNRKSHSTPYLSELKRGIYFCCGLTKNTMYRPQMSKMICDYYKPKIVLDPCAGWGGRLLGSVSSGSHYIAFEPNTKTYNNLQNMIKFLSVQDKVTLICDDALNMEKYDLPKVDLILTSPPYFDLEVYTDEPTQSHKNHSTYDEWSEKFLKQVIFKSLNLLNENGHSCWNVGKVGKKNMFDCVDKYHIEYCFKKSKNFSIVSSKRQSLQKKDSTKSLDYTVSYSKEQKVFVDQ